MGKRDLKKELKHLYTCSDREFERVQVGPLNYLMVDGHGNPNTSHEYGAAVEALFSVSYAVKFASKAAGLDYSVMPLEGLWSAADPGSFVRRNKDAWDWSMMILQPDWISGDQIERAIAATAKKKSSLGLSLLRFETYAEGDSVQILHIGSYDNEGPTLANLHDNYLPSNGLTFNGKHHEIYLSDPRRIVPEKLKTILRQPIRPIAAGD